MRPPCPGARRRARRVPAAALGRGARRAVARHVKARQDRLQQVWFTGMHADVGGGYPDESLSYVSLLWMMEEAEKAGPAHAGRDQGSLRRARQQRRPDSRQPRRAGRLLPLPAAQDRRVARSGRRRGRSACAIRRSPTRDGRPHGLLRTVKVHESVINRIANGTDRYAPITLPETFEIVPPQVEGENVPQADSDAGGRGRGRAARDARDCPARAAAGVATTCGPAWRGRTHGRPGPRPSKRCTTSSGGGASPTSSRSAFTLLLATMPVLGRAGARTALAGATAAPGSTRRCAPSALLVPSMFAYWVNTFAEQPFYFLVLAALHLARHAATARDAERRLRDRRAPHLARRDDIEGAVASRRRNRARSRAFRNATPTSAPSRCSSGACCPTWCCPAGDRGRGACGSPPPA